MRFIYQLSGNIFNVALAEYLYPFSRLHIVHVCLPVVPEYELERVCCSGSWAGSAGTPTEVSRLSEATNCT